MLDEEEKTPKRQGFLEQKPRLALLITLLPFLFMFSLNLLSSIVDMEQLGDNISLKLLALNQILFAFTMLFIVLGIARLYKGDPFQFIYLTKLPPLNLVLVSLFIIISSNFFLNYLVDLNALIPLPESLEIKFKALHDTTIAMQGLFLDFKGIQEILLVFITMAIMPALWEECYFRGLIQGVLVDLKLPAFTAIFISGFLFATIHFQFYYILPLFFMGCVLGYIYYRTRNLWLSIIAHLFNNGLIVIFTALNKNNLTQIDVEATPPWYVSLVGLATFILLIYSFHSRTKSIRFNE